MTQKRLNIQQPKIGTEPSTDSGQPEKKEESSTSEDKDSEDSNAEKSKD